MSSLSSLWDERFVEDSGRAVARYSKRSGNEPFDVGDILAATKSRLPYIGPGSLQLHGMIGIGSSFNVTREVYTEPPRRNAKVAVAPYFVAVKRMKLPTKSEENAEARQRCLGAVYREVRALMHPAIRDHCCIIPVFGYGWTMLPWEESKPYLVMDYTDHGNLVQYLKRINMPFREVYELVVDIAVGIKLLHEHGIIHGDIKAENILIFDSSDDRSLRPQTAKIADFGSSIFEDEADSKQYLGTPIFNAPEVEGRPRYRAEAGRTEGKWQMSDNIPKMTQYQKADVYSFGLLLWQILRDGGNIVPTHWFDEGQSPQDFLASVSATEVNGMLWRVRVFCELHKDRGLDSFLSLFSAAFKLSLQDDASRRGSMSDLVDVLSKESKEIRGATPYPLLRSLPPSEWSGPVPANAVHLQRPMPLPKDAQKARVMSIKYIPIGDQSRLAKTTPVTSMDSTWTTKTEDSRPDSPPSSFVYQVLDMFEVAVGMSTPWSIQANIVDKLKLDTRDSEPDKAGTSYLHLSICYLLGFGVEPNLAISLECLQNAASNNFIARSVLSRVFQASSRVISELEETGVISLDFDWRLDTLTVNNDHDYFVKRVQSSQLTEPTHIAGTREDIAESKLSSAAAKGGSIAIKRLPDGNDDDEQLIQTAILAAAEHGHYKTLMLLLNRCHAYNGSMDEPTPLHWLFMFNEPELSSCAEMLIIGHAGQQNQKAGICANFLGSRPSKSKKFPEHCLDLFGSPLHWAVRMRHLPLVKILIKLGADVNLRMQNLDRWAFDRSNDARVPDYSPLDLATVFHLPEVVDVLLAAGAEVNRPSIGSYYPGYSALHLVGQPVIPFAREILHGNQRQEAVRFVIQSLINAGCDINARDGHGDTPLARALVNPDVPDYVIAELLNAGASVDGSIASLGENAAIIVAQSAPHRLMTISTMKMVLPLVPYVNECDRESPSQNALHYCAAVMSGKLTELLVNDRRVAVDEKNSIGQTALHIAATNGGVDVADHLIRAGAGLETKDSSSRAALEIATTRRWTKLVHFLIEMGAQCTFVSEDEAPRGTVLHAAVANADDGNSITAELLQYHHAFWGNSVLLNATDSRGWTALHQAAFYGDVQSVKALVDAGAERLFHSTGSGELGWDNSPAYLTASHALDYVKANKILPAHQRIKDGGPSEMVKFQARLEEVVTILRP